MGTNVMDQSPLKVGSLDELVSNTTSLISLPEIYLKIKRLMDDQTSDIHDFAGAVTTDPNLTSAVLKLINSPFYGFSGQIQAIDRAVNLLGLGQLHDLVLALSAVDSIRKNNDIELLKTFWKRSIYCGVLARQLAERRGLREPSCLFVIGLLHEIGRMLLYMKHPEAVRNAISDALTRQRPLAESESSLFGYHYGDIGARLMADWNLPEKFQTVIRSHLCPEPGDEYQMEAMILGVSHKIAVLARPGVDPYDYPTDELGLDALEIEEAQLQTLLPEVEQLSIEMENMIIKD